MRAVARAAALLGDSAAFTLEIAGCDPLRVVRFSGVEAISSLFEFRLTVAGETAPLAAMVGKSALLTIEGMVAERHVHGLVREAAYFGESSSYTLYEVIVVPRVWRLGQRADCRVFQQVSTPEIVEQVLRRAGIGAADYRLELTGGYSPHDYCVQYRETDLDFVARLLEDAGIYYYFEHTRERHVLVLTDDRTGGPPSAGAPTLRFVAVEEAEHVLRFTRRESERPQRVTLRDVDLRAPGAPIEGSEGEGSEAEIYDYPGGFIKAGTGGPEQAGQQARLRLAALRSARSTGVGASESARLTPGYLFKLADARRGHLEGEYRISRVRHRGEQPQALDEGAAGEFSYANEFECVERGDAYHAPRVAARPVVRGAQTATVVGPAGEEVHVDDQGRVKVQFHWDREGQRDERSSCWVRVSQAWAGSGFGAVFLPRVGHEVIVDFLEGDPNRPLIIGRLYTGFNTPPYALPDDKTRSTIRSESTPGGGGFNELAFEDAKGREEIFLHAQKNWTVVVLNDKGEQIGRDELRAIGRDRRESIGKDHAEAIGGHMSVTVGATRSEVVGADASLEVGATLTESIALAKAESVGLAKAEQVGAHKSVAVGGDSSETIGGGKSLQAGDNVSASAGQNIALSAGKHVNVTAGQSLNVSAGKSAAVVVADKLTIQCGGATVTLSRSGDISIAADKLSVKSSGEVTVKGAKIKFN